LASIPTELRPFLESSVSSLTAFQRGVLEELFREETVVRYPARAGQPSATIGGYKVIKKWLSYREKPLLGRVLTIDEVRYVQEMARRIATILLLQPALDANNESVKRQAFAWPSAR
jgi:hypothetical protein